MRIGELLQHAINNCLEYADKNDVQVMIHTDTLNESGFVENTIKALKIELFMLIIQRALVEDMLLILLKFVDKKCYSIINKSYYDLILVILLKNI